MTTAGVRQLNEFEFETFTFFLQYYCWAFSCLCDSLINVRSCRFLVGIKIQKQIWILTKADKCVHSFLHMADKHLHHLPETRVNTEKASLPQVVDIYLFKRLFVFERFAVMYIMHSWLDSLSLH